MELKDLKVGDLVIMHTEYVDGIVPVQRITNTLIIVKDTKFRKHSGYQIGEGIYHRKHISIPTEDDIKRIKKETLKRKMEDTIYHFSERARREQVAFEDLQNVYDAIVSLKK